MVVCTVLLVRVLRQSPPAASASAAPLSAVQPVYGWAERGRMMAAILLWWLGFLFLNSGFPTLATVRLGMSEARGALVLELFLLAFTVASIPAGALATRWGRRPVVQGGSLLLGAALLAVALLGPAPLVVTGLMLLAGIGWAGVMANNLPMLLALGSEERLGSSTGLYYLCFALAGFAGPWLLRAIGLPAGASIWLAPLAWLLTLPLVATLPRGAGEG